MEQNEQIISQQYSIRSRLWQLVVVGFLIILTTIGLTLIQVNRIGKESKNITEKHLKVSNLCIKIDEALSDVIFYHQNYLISRKALTLQKAERIWDSKVIAQLDSILVLAHNLSDVQLTNKTTQLRQEANRLEDRLAVLVKLSKDDVLRVEEVDLQIQEISSRMHQSLYSIYRLEEKSITNSSENIQLYSLYNLYISITSSFIFVVLAAYFGFKLLNNNIVFSRYMNEKLETFLQGDIPTPIQESIREFSFLAISINNLIIRFKRLKRLAEEVSIGNFGTQVRVFEDKGELGEAIKGMRKSLDSISQANQERNWINEGISKMSEVLRKDDEPDFYSQVISNLVNYLGINQGGIFVLDDETNPEMPVMELKAAYAFHKEKYIKKTVQYGENLVGTVWREKDIIYMNELPYNYAYITSGLGGARPRSIVVAPLIADDQILGIVELASFEDIKHYQIEFIKRIGESIAITISRVKINTKNQQILESSRLLTEELQRKETEYNKNLRQLDGLREQISNTQNALETRMNALDKAFAIMEITPEGRLVQVNEKLLAISGYEREDLIGQSFTVLLRESLRDVKDAWQSLLQGDTHVGDFKRYTKTGKLYWMNEVIFPVLNKQGVAERVFSIGYEITTQKEQEKLIKRQLKALKAVSMNLEDESEAI